MSWSLYVCMCEWAVRCREGVNEVASCRKKNTCAANRQSQEKTFVCVCACVCMWKKL